MRRVIGKLLMAIGICWSIAALWWWVRRVDEYWKAKKQYPQVKLDKLTSDGIEEYHAWTNALASQGAIPIRPGVTAREAAEAAYEEIDLLKRLLPIVERKRDADRRRNMQLGFSIACVVVGAACVVWPRTRERRPISGRSKEDESQVNAFLADLDAEEPGSSESPP